MNWYWPGFCRAPFFPFSFFFFFSRPPVPLNMQLITRPIGGGAGGSRCLRLIPIPRNRRSTSHVRFNIFDRYLVPRLFPPSILCYGTYTYIQVGIIIPALLAANFRSSTKALSVSDRDFEIVASSGLSFAVYLLEKKMGRFETWGSRFAKDDDGDGEMKIKRRGRDFSRSISSNF